MLYCSVHTLVLFYIDHVILISAYTGSILHRSCSTDQCMKWFYFTYIVSYWWLHKLILFDIFRVILMSTSSDFILHTFCHTDQYIDWFYFTYILYDIQIQTLMLTVADLFRSFKTIFTQHVRHNYVSCIHIVSMESGLYTQKALTIKKNTKKTRPSLCGHWGVTLESAMSRRSTHRSRN